jgi:hypothetical protein
MVALVITSVVVTALFTLARGATETFNQQQRTAEMQLRLRFAMEQLRADVSRAAYLSTPNSLADPRVCPRPTRALQGVEVTQDSGGVLPLGSDNGSIRPVRLTLTGNFASVDEYLVAGISGSTIYLQNQTPQWTLRMTSEAEVRRVVLGPGGRRLLRITSTAGNTQFVQATDVVYADGVSTTPPSIRVTPPPVLVGDASTGGSVGCGVVGLGVGSTVSPVLRVQYAIENIRTEQPELYPADTTLANTKTDLIRREFDITDSDVAVPGGVRPVGEYAVDLDVGLAVDDGMGGAASGPAVLRTIDFGATEIFDRYGASLRTVASATPHRIRSLIVRLSLRDREQDPQFGFPGPRGSGAPLTRFRVFADRPGAARVRTLTAEITLPNQANRNLR